MHLKGNKQDICDLSWEDRIISSYLMISYFCTIREFARKALSFLYMGFVVLTINIKNKINIWLR